MKNVIHPLFHVLFDAVDDKGPFSPDVAYSSDAAHQTTVFHSNVRKENKNSSSSSFIPFCEETRVGQPSLCTQY